MNTPIKGLDLEEITLLDEIKKDIDVHYIAITNKFGEFICYQCTKCLMKGGNSGNMNVHKYNCPLKK